MNKNTKYRIFMLPFGYGIGYGIKEFHEPNNFFKFFGCKSQWRALIRHYGMTPVTLTFRYEIDAHQYINELIKEETLKGQ